MFDIPMSHKKINDLPLITNALSLLLTVTFG